MRFSTFLNARSMGPEQDRAVMLGMIDHAERAEASGFDAVFLPDHHFTGYMPMASDPFLFAAYLAARLKRVHFGFSVTTVPLHHPVRFVERINILDQLTEGRILVGVGSGTTPEEMIGFGVNYKEASRLAEENLAIAETLWAKAAHDAPIVFDNGHYKGEVVQRIAPVAYTPGHAKLMPVAMKETSARRAAEHGWPAFIPAFTPPRIGGTEPMVHVRKYFTAYRDMLMAAGHAPEVVAHALSWSTHTYQCVHVAETDAQARRELEDILTVYQEAVDREAAFNAKAEATEANKKTDRTPNALTEDWIGTWCLYGSPETVIEHLRPYQELGIGNILCGMLTGPLTERRMAYANQTLDLMARKVIPALREGGR
ncbi:LLM class flavin-dependent oxidoreductase [Nitrospirillum sp. BR 11163]|uniref:LLM class flavin-dependent oxidoreductase n=1 Tax=Nitrospirillum sp. BR 11163 TaxID=3104323 RepID=UPI002AFE0123|nr:LLM class flavin-dependent oxidoreductase [Nitrospirillum sp. BR 11163]MEA1672046.1 LLM class flavin-dependent oxidoreductase [Nitrospirillum sp. BR 11163]